MSRFVFLDRDGTLVEDAGYTHRLEDYRLLPGVVAGLRRLAAAGWRFAVVTNQSGIGRGTYSQADYERFQEKLIADLRAQGIEIERSYHCPHRPDEGCACRKPAPGLLERARAELGAELGQSWVVGNDERDVELARRGGCAGSVRVGPGRDLAAAAELILAAGRERDAATPA